MNKEIKIIILGDIFDNIETEEKAFRFVYYIKDLQQKVEQLEKENKILKENAEHNDKVVDKVNWENMLLKGKINEDFDKFNDELNNFKWLENDFKEHSIHYYQLECLVEYLKQLKVIKQCVKKNIEI